MRAVIVVVVFVHAFAFCVASLFVSSGGSNSGGGIASDNSQLGVSLCPTSEDNLLGGRSSGQGLDVRPELDDFAQQVFGFALPVGHGFVVVGSTERVLMQMLV